MLNRIAIAGRLTRDAEVRYTQSETAVASFTVAVDQDYAPKGMERGTDFFNCVAWREKATFVENNFHKGSAAIIEGRLKNREYEAKDGSKRTVAEIIVENIYFGESKASAEAHRAESAPAAPATPAAYSRLEDADGELPF